MLRLKVIWISDPGDHILTPLSDTALVFYL